MGSEVKHGRRRLGVAKSKSADQSGLFSLVAELSKRRERRRKDHTIQKRTEPALIEPMQCKSVTALPADEKWTFEIKFDGYRCIVGKRAKEVTLFWRLEKVLNSALPASFRRSLRSGLISLSM